MSKDPGFHWPETEADAVRREANQLAAAARDRYFKGINDLRDQYIDINRKTFHHGLAIGWAVGVLFAALLFVLNHFF